LLELFSNVRIGLIRNVRFRSAKRTLSASVFKEFCHERAWFDHGDYA
jgi:hypothetical protein